MEPKFGKTQVVEGFVKAVMDRVPEGASVVELGSGAGSTAALAPKYRLTSVEHDPKYVGMVPESNYVHAPVAADGWYDPSAVAAGLPGKIDALIVDGPKGTRARLAFLSHYRMFEGRGRFPVFVDDAQREDGKRIARELAKAWDMDAERVEEGGKVHVILTPRIHAPEDPGEPVDAVFILGTGSKNMNTELRYALRSMAKFCPWVRQVWVVGENPGFLSGKVKFIPHPDPYTHCKDANIIGKFLRACREPGLAPVFLACSDDCVVTRPCSPADFAPRYLREWSEADSAWYDRKLWTRRLRDTLRLFGEGARYFQPHIWSPYRKDAFLRMADGYAWRNNVACTHRTLYYNSVGERGVPDFGHAFVGAVGLPPADATHVAYGDKAIDRPEFRAWLSAMFPEKCRFEA